MRAALPNKSAVLSCEQVIDLDGMGADAHSMRNRAVVDPSKPSKYNFLPMRHAKSCGYAIGLWAYSPKVILKVIFGPAIEIGQPWASPKGLRGSRYGSMLGIAIETGARGHAISGVGLTGAGMAGNVADKVVWIVRCRSFTLSTTLVLSTDLVRSLTGLWWTARVVS